MKKAKVSRVSETNLGIYVWQLPDGGFLHDGNPLNVLSIASMRGDISKMIAISNEARVCGYPEGKAVFVEGARKISDDEFAEQVWRMRNGLTPDVLDIGSYKDDVMNYDNK